MKTSILITLFLIANICFSQTKEKLLKTIEKANIVESDCVGPGCNEGQQYLNFQRLKKQLSEKELNDLAKAKNPVLRCYAYRDVIQPNNQNVVDFLAFELKENVEVLTYEGCSEGLELVSSIVYHEYWNKIRIEATERYTTKDQNEQEKIMQERLESDLVMEKLDSVVIHTEKNVYWLLYLRAFKNRKHKDSFIPRIEKLAFEQNNAYALVYLKKYYPIQSEQKIKLYFENNFQKETFQRKEDAEYFTELIEYLVNSNDEKFIEIAITKLKQDKKVWENDSYRILKLLEKNKIKL
jgi:hypothetical protein